MTIELKACPVCGGQVNIVTRRSSYFDPRPLIMCESCGLTTREFETPEALIEYWNGAGNKGE